MRLGKRNLTAVLGAIALLGAVPAAASAEVGVPIRAVFLKEYSKPNYTVAQGDIVVFSNEDPFLSHGVFSTAFSAPTIPPGSSALVSGAPFLRPGTYAFGDQSNPGMTSSLTVTTAGAPLPADPAPPTATEKIISKGKEVARKGKVRVRVVPNEPVTASIKVGVGRQALGKASLALALGTRGTVGLTFDPAIAKLSGRFTLQVKGQITDIAGHTVPFRKSATLNAGKKKKK